MNGPQTDMTRTKPALDVAKMAGTAGFRRLLALHVLRVALRLGFLAAAATVVGSLVMDRDLHAGLIAAAPVLLVLSALAGFVTDRAQADLEAQVAATLRNDAGRRLDAMTARQVQAIPVGGLVVAMQRYPAAIAGLVVGHRIARMMMAIGPLMAAAALMLVSWQAALTVLVLTPVMIIFFMLVGDMIRSRARAQEEAFGHLAGQFADRIRTLPTILANHALPSEEQKLAKRLRAYADRTMGVLRIAFLNAGIIDFFSSLSIAMLAVFLGLGHLGLANIPGFSGLELWQSLFILMIAPDYFAPFRRFAEQYHAKAEGEAAAAALDRLLSPQPSAFIPAIDLGLPYSLSDLPSRGLVAITGVSGSGKTTLLRHLAGVDGATASNAVSWISTDSYVPEGTLADTIAWNGGPSEAAALENAARQVGLLDDRHLPGGIDATIAPGGANLSGGQRLRVAVARASISERTILADEPTAKLDAGNAARVRDLLRHLAAQRLVVVATHDAELARIADQTIELTPLAAQSKVPA